MIVIGVVIVVVIIILAISFLMPGSKNKDR